MTYEVEVSVDHGPSKTFSFPHRLLAEEFIGGTMPIEMKPGKFYPRSRVVLYELKELDS